VAKILVADDNSNIQKMVGLALKDQGIDVVAVGNGEAAVRKISDIHPDLVLADVFMPVRNGYEVCRYVKENSALAHIPVILLVGAFDPLDEQEAQRSGADGVLKKPFVPPDPLVSMVKSALMRAGVPLGPASKEEKTPAAPKRSTADLLNAGMGSKLPAFPAEKVPVAVPEPVEEFPTPTPPAQVKIAHGSEPLAFGSLLETPKSEEEILTSKPMIHLAAEREWDEEADEVEEEKEEGEDSPGGGWRPAGLDEDLEHAAAHSKAVPDWRDEAFHGSSPAKGFSSQQWPSSLAHPEFVEASATPSVAVTTVAAKPVDGPVPFAGDAWAAAMASGVQEELAEVKDLASVVPDAVPATAATETFTKKVPGTPAALAESAPVQSAPVKEEPAPAEPANWAAVPETAWEMEAKKASLLASTWDAPKTYSVDDTQDLPAYTAETPTEHVEAPTESPAELSAYSAEPLGASETAGHAEAVTGETIPEPGIEASSRENWKNTSEPPAAVPSAMVAEESHAEASRVENYAVEPATFEQTATAEAAQPDMDELVARVLGKMNPEVLQKITREILKPVIEAVVRDEISAKKS
jgi:CheY-like chemotaxis protein